MKIDNITWTWNGETIQVGTSRLGAGPELLMLPALSSISTRHEMRPLQEQLASSFATVALDWPGFGDLPRPPVAWQPEAYRAFLQFVLTKIVQPAATVAAGHAAGYVLDAAAKRPGSAGRLCLVAPTWRGPLPTMMGKRHEAFSRLARAIDNPLYGPALYRLNVNRFVVNMMVRGHVYSNPAWLEGKRLEEKFAVINAPGARHSSFRFVSGELDPMLSREDFLETAGRIAEPLLVVYGAKTPRKSKAEMTALASLPNIQSVQLPDGKLNLHEEFAGDVAGVVKDFLAAVPSRA